MWKRNQEPRDEWKPTNADTQFLAEQMKGLETITVGKKRYGAFEQAVAKDGTIRLDAEGIVVRNVEQWQKALKTQSLLEWQQGKDMDALFQAYPEERETYESKLDVIRAQIRAIVGSKAISLTNV